MARSFRMFGTHRMFKWRNSYATKLDATKEAKKYRSKGVFARVVRGVRFGGEWEVWATGR